MESPDISAIANVESDEEINTTSISLIPRAHDALSPQEDSETLGESESLLADLPQPQLPPPSANNNLSFNSEPIEESQSLLAGARTLDHKQTPNKNHSSSEDLFADSEIADDKTERGGDSEMVEIIGTSDVVTDSEMMEQQRESEEGGYGQIVDEESSEVRKEGDGGGIDVNDDDTAPDETEEMEADEEGGDDENDENEAGPSAIRFPFGRVKKIMKMCLAVNEEEGVEIEKEVAPVWKGKKKTANKKSMVGNSTENMVLNKDAIYLTAKAAELFVMKISQQATRLTIAAKKKTVTVDHLKRVLSDSESNEFLQGCFQPSLIIGD